MRILGIETSCDETSLAIVEASGGLRAPRFKVLKNLVASQIKIHRPFGGVVPNLAKREHIKNLPILYRQIFEESNKSYRTNKTNRTYKSNIGKLNFPGEVQLPKIDLIAVTVGPGLEPALWAGISFAKELRKRFAVHGSKFKVIGVNHLEGHLYSFLLSKNYELRTTNLFPAIALVVSGGHTILLKMDSLIKWKKLGETLDDAVGEAFDKVARLLNLLYPGGPELEKLAKKGNPDAVNFPRPMIHAKNLNFSFSGLKTSVLYYLRDNPEADKADVAASFQKAAIDVLVKKTVNAAKIYGGASRVKSIILCGGVAANKLLRKTLAAEAKKLRLQFFVPDFEYNTDNAAMIAVAGYMAHLRLKAPAVAEAVAGRSGGQAHLRGKKYPLAAWGDLGI